MTIARTPPVRTFAALANPIRWQLLSLVSARSQSASALASQVPVSRPAALKHLAVLHDAGLVERELAGREVRFVARTQPLTDAAEWISAIAITWEHRLANLKNVAEGGALAEKAPSPSSSPDPSTTEAVSTT